VRFVKESFAIDVSEETVRRVLLQSGFSSQKTRRRTAGYKFDLEPLIGLYEKDLERLWALGIKDLPPQRVACMDSPSLGWRLLKKNVFSERSNRGCKEEELRGRESGDYSAFSEALSGGAEIPDPF
jgi:hypothetical protein